LHHRSRKVLLTRHKHAESSQPGFRGRGRGSMIGRGRGQGRGFGRGFGRGNYQNPYYQGVPQTQSGNSTPAPDNQPPFVGQGSSNNGHSAMPSNMSNVPHFGNNGSQNYYGFMARIKFRSSIATCDERKKNVSLLDSGGSHNFYFSRDSFSNYRQIEPETVTVASSTSMVVGNGTICVPIDGGIHIEAYHAPEFSTNILSVGKLSEFFTVMFTSDPPAIAGVPTCIIYRRGSTSIVYQTQVEDGLFTLNDSDNSSASSLEAAYTVYTSGLGGPRKKNIDLALEWHCRTGHPSADRYMRLSHQLSELPKFSMETLRNILCIPCSIYKAKRAPISGVPITSRDPLELIHIDILGPITPPSLSGNKYALGIVDDRTAKTDVFFLPEKKDLTDHLINYQARSERVTGFLLQNIRLDGAGENRSEIITNRARLSGISLDYSPPYAPQSNGIAERYMQELSLRGRVLLGGSKLEKNFWEEAMRHGNWLRNRLPSERIEGRIPILEWKPTTKVSFEGIPSFGEQGFAFLYTSNTKPRKKLAARSVPAYFVGLHSEQTLLRVYVPETKRIILVRRGDFRPVGNSKLPGIETLIDGLSKQSLIEVEEEVDGQAEEGLQQAFQMEQNAMQSFHTQKRKLFDARVPRNFTEAIAHKSWCDAIDREYYALVARNVWRYLPRTNNMNPLPYTWVFRIKPLDTFGRECLHKARCCVRGDLQDPAVDFDPSSLYAPVASHESIRLLFAIAARDNLIVEGGDVANAYLYGKIDFPVLMEQPTNSSCKEAMPGHVCELLQSMYGLRQAGKIWGSLLCQTLLGWKFTQSSVDPRVFFKVVNNEFIIVVIVVDDMNFASNSTRLLDHFKLRLKATFDVKLFGQLRTFVGWEISQRGNGIIVSQSRYTRELLEKHNMQNANGVWTPLPLDADVGSAEHGEPILASIDHTKFRTSIGELLYLAVCSRPDISFAVAALARNVHAPTQRHMDHLRRVLRYLSGTRTLGICFPRSCSESQEGLQAFSDSDWAGCKKTRKSTTGFVVTLGGAPVSWKSVKQTVVSLSSAEAEYIALSTCAKELTWIRRLCWEMINRKPYVDIARLPTTTSFVDNTAALSMAKQDQISAKSKHVEVKFHHVKHLVSSGEIRLQYVPTNCQVADILTKSVSNPVLVKHREFLLVEKDE